MDCLAGIAKYVLFIFNFLITLCGILFVVFGVLIIKSQKDDELQDMVPYHIGELAIGVGVIIFIIAFFGCWGAIKESSCLLTTYAIVLITILIIQVVLAALAFVAIKKNGLESEVEKTITSFFNHYDTKKAPMDTIQETFECCGKDGPTDWALKVQTPPDTCYKNKNHKELFTEGCIDAVTDYLNDKSKTIGIVALVFGAVEIVGAIFAFMVRNNN